MSVEIALPFGLALDGRVAFETDDDKQLRQHVESLVGTEPGERVMLPGYGVPLTQLLFDPDDTLVEENMAQFVSSAMAVWEPGLVLTTVTPLGDVTGDGLASLEVDFARADGPLSPIPAQHINTAVLHVGGSVSEVIRG